MPSATPHSAQLPTKHTNAQQSPRQSKPNSTPFSTLPSTTQSKSITPVHPIPHSPPQELCSQQSTTKAPVQPQPAAGCTPKTLDRLLQRVQLEKEPKAEIKSTPSDLLVQRSVCGHEPHPALAPPPPPPVRGGRGSRRLLTAVQDSMERGTGHGTTAEGACPVDETEGTPQPGGSSVRSATACTAQATGAAAGGDECCRPNQGALDLDLPSLA